MLVWHLSKYFRKPYFLFEIISCIAFDCISWHVLPSLNYITEGLAFAVVYLHNILKHVSIQRIVCRLTPDSGMLFFFQRCHDLRFHLNISIRKKTKLMHVLTTMSICRILKVYTVVRKSRNSPRYLYHACENDKHKRSGIHQ